MENASKALLMAGSMLIAIAILSTFVYVFREGSRVAASYDEKQARLSLAKYNAQYEAYIKEWTNQVEIIEKNEDNENNKETHYDYVDYITNNSIYDMISIMNLAYTANRDFDYDGQNSLTIKVVDGIGKTLFQINDSSKGKELKSNQVLLGVSEKPTYIFNLAEMTIGNLDITPSGVDYDSNDKLSYSELRYDENYLKKNYTWYKYLFYCKDVKYNSYGRIVGMTFEMRNNKMY